MKRLFLDQYGGRFFASTVRDLRRQIEGGGSRVHRMFQDKKNGSVVACGYVIGSHWLTEYAPVEKRV